MSPDPRRAALRDLLAEAHSLHKAAELLVWDQQTYMPRGGGEARMVQSATLLRLVHERLAAPDLGRLLDELAAGGAPSDGGDDGALLRWARREHERRRRLPAALVEELAREASRGLEVWTEARAKGDFTLFQPSLERMVALKLRQAEALGPCDDPYDAWLEEFEPGMKTAEVRRLFAELKAGLLPLVRDVLAKAGSTPISPSFSGPFDIAKQRILGEEAAAAIGFDFTRGRQDQAPHPFTMSCSPDDVRITTRYREEDPFIGLYGTLHEAGHGIYEQGMDPALRGTPLCAGTSLGIHESQSRLWENLVGRSRGFWRRFAPRFAELFPQAADLGPEGLYRAVNRVRPSFIRVEADELTYSLHVLLRFELESDLVAGRLAVLELPEAWNAKMASYLGVTPPDDRVGVLQDVHWSEGLLGYFPTYVLGNMLSAQLHRAATSARPGIRAAADQGDFAPLRDWLRENVLRHGRRFTAPELVRRAAGGPIEAGPYLDYLRAKYGELYGL